MLRSLTPEARRIVVILFGGVVFLLAGVLFGYNGIAALICALFAWLVIASLWDARGGSSVPR